MKEIKEILENQLKFAIHQKEHQAGEDREWYGYIQGLEYALTQIEIFEKKREEFIAYRD